MQSGIHCNDLALSLGLPNSLKYDVIFDLLIRLPVDLYNSGCSSAACTARRLTESVASAASAACDSLLHAESLIQLGLLPKPCSHVLRVPHVRQSYNWSAAFLSLSLLLFCCADVYCCLSTGVHPEEQHHLCSRS